MRNGRSSASCERRAARQTHYHEIIGRRRPLGGPPDGAAYRCKTATQFAPTERLASRVGCRNRDVNQKLWGCLVHPAEFRVGLKTGLIFQCLIRQPSFSPLIAVSGHLVAVRMLDGEQSGIPTPENRIARQQVDAPLGSDHFTQPWRAGFSARQGKPPQAPHDWQQEECAGRNDYYVDQNAVCIDRYLGT